MEKKKILMLLLPLSLIIVVIGASFAIFNYSRLGETSSTIQSGDIEFSFIEGDSILLENAFPVSDSIGAVDTKNAYQFTVKMKTSSSKLSMLYNVALITNNNSTNHFTNDEIKYNLEKNDDYIVGSATSGVFLSSLNGFDEGSYEGNSTILTNQKISNNQIDTYKLRIWIAEDVDYTGEIQSDGMMEGTKNAYTYSLKVKISTPSGSDKINYNAGDIEYVNGETSDITSVKETLDYLYDNLGSNE